jgi:hypothetical protein
MAAQQIYNAIFSGKINEERRKSERSQQVELNKQARKVHSHEKEVFNAEKNDYFAMRDFAYETNITNWEYGKQIQDYQYARDLATYEKSQDIYESRLGYNQQASALAIGDQQAAIQDLALSQAFQREAMHSDLMNEIKRGGIQKLEQGAKLYGIKSNRRISDEAIQQQLNQVTTQNTFEKEAKFVEGLQQSGKAALGQAGVSRKKTLQSTAAESFRNLVALDSSLSGSRNKAAVDLLKVYVDASLGETQVGLNLDMIELGINAAKDEVKYNNRILEANMQSAIGQMGRNIQQIQLQKMGADLKAEADLNIFPEKFDYAPEPQLGPARTFIKPLKTEPGQVPKGARINPLNEALSAGAQIAQFVASGGVKNIKNLFGPGGGGIGGGIGGGGGGGGDIFADIASRGGLDGGTPYNFNLFAEQASNSQAFGDGGILSFANYFK